MKKVLCIILLLSMLLSFSSCASKNDQQNNSTTEKETTSQASQSSTTEQNTNQDTSITENNTDDNISDSDEDDIEDNEVDSNENSDNSSALKHYEIDLDINNYETYLKYKSESFYNSSSGTHLDFTHTISGVLTYAFYENVTITFDITYQTSGSYPKTYTGVYTVKLNAAGNAEFSADDSKLLEAIECPRYDRLMTKTFSIKEVSGKVMFAI